MAMETTTSTSPQPLSSGPWFIMGKFFHLRPWSRDRGGRKEFFETMPLWIRLPNLPLQFWSFDYISRIVSALGNPLFLDDHFANSSKLQFIRVCVEASARTSLPNSICVEVEDVEGSSFEQIVEYESKPKVCSNCLIFGHDLVKCKSGFSIRSTLKYKTGSSKASPSAQEQGKTAKIIRNEAHINEGSVGKITSLHPPINASWIEVVTKKKKSQSKQRLEAGVVKQPTSTVVLFSETGEQEQYHQQKFTKDASKRSSGLTSLGNRFDFIAEERNLTEMSILGCCREPVSGDVETTALITGDDSEGADLRGSGANRGKVDHTRFEFGGEEIDRTIFEIAATDRTGAPCHADNLFEYQSDPLSAFNQSSNLSNPNPTVSLFESQSTPTPNKTRNISNPICNQTIPTLPILEPSLPKNLPNSMTLPVTRPSFFPCPAITCTQDSGYDGVDKPTLAESEHVRIQSQLNALLTIPVPFFSNEPISHSTLNTASGEQPDSSSGQGIPRGTLLVNSSIASSPNCMVLEAPLELNFGNTKSNSPLSCSVKELHGAQEIRISDMQGNMPCQNFDAVESSCGEGNLYQPKLAGVVNPSEKSAILQYFASNNREVAALSEEEDRESGPPGFISRTDKSSEENSMETATHVTEENSSSEEEMNSFSCSRANMVREKLRISILGTDNANKAFVDFYRNRQKETKIIRKKSVVPDVSINLKNHIGKKGNLSRRVVEGRKKKDRS